MQAKIAKDGSTTLNQLAKKSFKINGPLLVETFAEKGPSFVGQLLNHFSTRGRFYRFKTATYNWLRSKDGCGDGPLLAAGWLRGLPEGEPSPPTKADDNQPFEGVGL